MFFDNLLSRYTHRANYNILDLIANEISDILFSVQREQGGNGR